MVGAGFLNHQQYFIEYFLYLANPIWGKNPQNQDSCFTPSPSCLVGSRNDSRGIGSARLVDFTWGFTYIWDLTHMGPLEDTKRTLHQQFLFRNFFLYGGLGKSAVSSQGMWAKSLSMSPEKSPSQHPPWQRRSVSNVNLSSSNRFRRGDGGEKNR